MESAVSRPVLIGQLTDTHVLAVDDTDTEVFVDNNARLADAVDQLNVEAPVLDALLMTGDLTDDGRPDQFDALMTLVEPLTMPVLPIPGNHDDVEAFTERFDMPWADGHASWSVDVGGVRVVGLDSTTPGRHGGSIDATRADWLGGVLAAAHDGPTLLAVHHPPFLSGIHWMDEGGIIGVERLEEVLREHPVDRIVCGHLHRSVTSTFADIVCQVGMSTVQHVHLDLAERATVAVVDDPAGYQIHRVAGNEIATHSRFIRSGAPIVPAWAVDHG